MFRQRDNIKKILEWRGNKATTTTKSEIKRIKQMGVAGKELEKISKNSDKEIGRVLHTCGRV